MGGEEQPLMMIELFILSFQNFYTLRKIRERYEPKLRERGNLNFRAGAHLVFLDGAYFSLGPVGPLSVAVTT